MSGEILTCLGHTDWHYFEPCIYKEMEKEKGCFTAYLDSSPTVLIALTELGEGAEPLVEVLKGCEESCSQYYVLNNSTYPNTILYGGISSNY